MFDRTNPSGPDTVPDEALPRPVCTAVIGSMTGALQAEQVLRRLGIPARVAKISSSAVQNGCAYGVDFPCMESAVVQAALTNADLHVRRYLQG